MVIDSNYGPNTFNMSNISDLGTPDYTTHGIYEFPSFVALAQSLLQLESQLLSFVEWKIGRCARLHTVSWMGVFH